MSLLQLWGFGGSLHLALLSLFSHPVEDGTDQPVAQDHGNEQHGGDRGGVAHVEADGAVVDQVRDDRPRGVVRAWEAREVHCYVRNAEGLRDGHDRGSSTE